MVILPTDIQILFTNYDIITYFLNLASCSEHFISIKHRILPTFNINKKKSILTACMPLKKLISGFTPGEVVFIHSCVCDWYRPYAYLWFLNCDKHVSFIITVIWNIKCISLYFKSQGTKWIMEYDFVYSISQ